MTLLRITYPENLGVQRVETVEVFGGPYAGVSDHIEQMAEKIEVIDTQGNVKRVLKDRHGPTS